MELPIVEQQKIKTYLQYGLPLCIIMTEEKYHPWVLEKFIQIKSFPVVSKAGNCLKYSMDNWPKNDLTKIEYGDVFNVSKENWAEIADPVSYVKASLGDRTYLYCELNEFYLSDKPIYKIKTKIHFSLIFGCVENVKKFSAFGFAKDGLFQRMQFGEQELIYASSIDKCLDVPDRDSLSVYPIKIKTPKQVYLFSVSSFKALVHDFLCPPEAGEWVYGSDSYSVILDNLKSLGAAGVHVKYNVFHFLAEHKNTFYLALRYIARTNGISSYLAPMINEYSGVVSIFEELRLCVMQISIKERKPFGVYNKTNLDEIQKRLLTAIDLERRVLYRLLDKLVAID